MKIICDRCSAKYSIADEKVAGKSFQIRCKKCRGAIVVRGEHLRQEDEATRDVAARSGESSGAVWHVARDGAQEGPFSAGQLGEMLASGAMDREAYVWREGFDDWLDASAVPALQALLPPLEVDAVGVDLFAQSHAGARPFEGDSAEPASMPALGQTENEAMTGQRNENSVLFSLSNLRALAPGAPRANAPKCSPEHTGQLGAASAEASGLIDIRALANVADVSPNNASAERVDEVLSIGTGSSMERHLGGLGGPVLGPVVEDKRDKSLLIAVAAVGGIVVIAAAAVIGVLLVDPTSVAVAVEPSTGAGPIASGAGLAPAPAPGALSHTMTDQPELAVARVPHVEDVEQAAVGAAAAEGPSVAGDDTDRRRPRDARGRGRPPRQPGELAQEGPQAQEAPEAPPSFNELLDRAVSMSGPTGLPQSPARSSVLRAVRSVSGAVGRCGNGQHGVATTAIGISGSDGRVSDVQVSGQFAGTPVGACVARAVRRAHFPRFQQRAFQVRYPYRI